MNKYIAIWCIVLTTVVACRKKDKSGKQCNYALFALQSTGNNFSRIVSVDTTTGKSYDNLQFPAIATYGGYLSKREKCYYVLQTAGGRLNLLRLDLVNKSVRTFIGPRRSLGADASINLTYSQSTNTFYFLDINNAVRPPGWGLYSIKIDGDSFTYDYLQPKYAPPTVLTPLVENELNGDIYFWWMNGGYTRYGRFIPSKNEMIETCIAINVYNMQFNSNDGCIYGCFPGLPLLFSRINPESGKVDSIGKISPPPGYDFSTFDVCKNQYIYENQGLDGNVYLYWLDVNTGSIMKQLTVKETYTHIMCVNLD